MKIRRIATLLPALTLLLGLSFISPAYAATITFPDACDNNCENCKGVTSSQQGTATKICKDAKECKNSNTDACKKKNASCYSGSNISVIWECINNVKNGVDVGGSTSNSPGGSTETNSGNNSSKGSTGSSNNSNNSSNKGSNKGSGSSGSNSNNHYTSSNDDVCASGDTIERAQCYAEKGGGGSSADLMPTLRQIMNVVLGFIGFIAVAMIVIGGITYITSAGEAGKTKKAKDTIMYGIIGLIIALLAAAIVNFVISNIF